MVYKPDKAIHPGHIIDRSLEREGMSQKNLSERTGLTEKHISQIINGEASVTVETALLLENALGGTASFWINLEKNYQETIARLEKVESLVKEIPLMSKFPYSELVKRGFVEQTSNKEKRVENLWKFFGVNSLAFIRQTEDVAYRKRDGVSLKSESIASWLRCGELETRKMSISSFSSTNLNQAVNTLRELTASDPRDYSIEAKKLFAESGVALVYMPHFPGTSVNGAVRWIGDNPIIQLSLLGAYADMFWFTLFHEIGHILLHGKKEKFLEFQNSDGARLTGSHEKEKEADTFAGDILVPQKEYNAFIRSGNISRTKIIKFAQDINVHPGIIAGRLCHDKKITWKDAAQFRVRLKFVA